jgi:hypothetical protein
MKTEITTEKEKTQSQATERNYKAIMKVNLEDLKIAIDQAFDQMLELKYSYRKFTIHHNGEISATISEDKNHRMTFNTYKPLAEIEGDGSVFRDDIEIWKAVTFTDLLKQVIG